MVKAGIIGTGKTIGIASMHLNGYQRTEGVELTAIYDIKPEAAREWCKRHELSEDLICETLDEFWGKVDAVSICTPNYLHIHYIKEALKNGKHVLCEKPLCTEVEDMDEIERLCKESPMVTAIGFNYRFIPMYITAKKLVESGVLGDIILYRHSMGGARFADPNIILEWRTDRDRSGAGSFIDFGSHAMYLLDFIVGIGNMEFKIFENTLIKQRELDGEKKNVTNDDVSVFIGKAENGMLASFVTTRVGGFDTGLEIIGTNASIKVANDVTICYKSENPFAPAKFEEYRGEHYVEPLDIGRTLPSCVPSFVKAIETGGEPDCDISYGVKIHKVLFGIEAQVL